MAPLGGGVLGSGVLGGIEDEGADLQVGVVGVSTAPAVGDFTPTVLPSFAGVSAAAQIGSIVYWNIYGAVQSQSSTALALPPWQQPRKRNVLPPNSSTLQLRLSPEKNFAPAIDIR